MMIDFCIGFKPVRLVFHQPHEGKSGEGGAGEAAEGKKPERKKTEAEQIEDLNIELKEVQKMFNEYLLKLESRTDAASKKLAREFKITHESLMERFKDPSKNATLKDKSPREVLDMKVRVYLDLNRYFNRLFGFREVSLGGHVFKEMSYDIVSDCLGYIRRMPDAMNTDIDEVINLTGNARQAFRESFMRSILDDSREYADEAALVSAVKKYMENKTPVNERFKAFCADIKSALAMKKETINEQDYKKLVDRIEQALKK
jgi:hypothetical protein